MNAAGGIHGKQIKVLINDDQSTNPGALAAVNKSIEQDKVLALLGTKGYVGVLGTYSFTSNGDSLHTATVVQIENGKPKLLKIMSVAPK